MPDVIDALVRFKAGWVEDGLGPDSLPLFRETVSIVLSKPPYLQIEREATEEDFEQFGEPYRAFLKEQGGRKPTEEGYPLALWPVITPADFQICAVRGIYTVEQLAKQRGDGMPPQIRELAARAKRLIELQGKTGKFETIIRQLEAERDTLAAELKEANTTISAQNSLINQLRPTKAA